MAHYIETVAVGVDEDYEMTGATSDAQVVELAATALDRHIRALGDAIDEQQGHIDYYERLLEGSVAYVLIADSEDRLDQAHTAQDRLQEGYEALMYLRPAVADGGDAAAVMYYAQASDNQLQAE